MTGVSPDRWRTAVSEAVAEGYVFFEWLGCVDEIGRAGFRVVVALRRIDTSDLSPTNWTPAEGGDSGRELRMISTQLPRDKPTLESLRDIFAGASWHEREVAELFGVVFVGGDSRRLLLASSFVGTPMRKDAVLAARAGVGWPGGKEPGETSASPSRRRMVPPGVPDAAVWGNRDPAAGEALAEDIAAATGGGRVRRRTP